MTYKWIKRKDAIHGWIKSNKIDFITVEKMNDKWNVIHFNKEKMNSPNIIYESKIKQLALKYAKNYMRRN